MKRNKHSEESSLSVSVVVGYAILAAFVISAFLFEDEVKARIDHQFNSDRTIVEYVQADEPAHVDKKIYLIDYMRACETYNTFAESVLGVTTKAEVDALIATDSSFTVIASNDYMTSYRRGGFGVFAEQRISFFFNEQQIFMGAIVNSPNIPLAIFAQFLQDQDEWHGCLGIPSELHEGLPNDIHLDSLRFVYPTGMAVNLFVLSSPATVVDKLVDFLYLISTAESEVFIKNIFMEMVRGKESSKKSVPDVRDPAQT